MLTRRQFIVTTAIASTTVVSGVVLQTAQADSAAAATQVPVDVDQWGVAVRGATTDITSIQFPKHFDAAELSNARTWVEENIRVAKYMASQGHAYSFKLWWERHIDDLKSKTPFDLTSPAAAALLGTATQTLLLSTVTTKDIPYSWQDGGIAGRVVHELNLDNAH